MKTILLIDDEESLRLIFSTTLREDGYCAMEAASGQAGLKLARRQLPDLTLTDISMPAIRSQDVPKQIRQEPEMERRLFNQ